ncbi:hypothetical protein D4R86_01855 [bacterium]|nr:MAG: hypothetical protein D4R86_01855 [bacterium]
MKEYFVICFRGCLNGKRKVFIDLCVIELSPKDNRIHFMFQCDLISYLHTKRGKNELGPKNGYQTAGWLDVLKISEIPKGYESEVIKVDDTDVTEIYRIIKNPLKKAIKEKIKIKGKGE